MNKKDVMELLYRIQKDCNNTRCCNKCHWFNEIECECMFFEDPCEWNVPGITERSVED